MIGQSDVQRLNGVDGCVDGRYLSRHEIQHAEFERLQSHSPQGRAGWRVEDLGELYYAHELHRINLAEEREERLQVSVTILSHSSTKIDAELVQLDTAHRRAWIAVW